MSDLLAKSPFDQKLARIVRPTVEGMGFELVRVRLMGGKSATLQIMAERPDGRMEIDDCADLSRALSAALDVEDPIEGEYSLEISSPGIDRPLTRPQDFETWTGFVAKLETETLLEGQKKFRGVLRGFRDGAAMLETENQGLVALPFDLLADAKLVLTDDLVAASMRAQKDRGFDPGRFDDVIETGDDAPEDEDEENDPR